MSYLLSNSAPHDPRCFWHRCSSVCSRIGQRHRAQQVDVTQDRTCTNGNLFVCVQRPAHQVSPPLIARRLAGARYQLDSQLVQAGIVDNGRHQEDPVVRWPGKHAYTDAICRNVITPLAHRFQTHGIHSQRQQQQQRSSCGGSVVSRERLRDRERLAGCDTQVESET